MRKTVRGIGVAAALAAMIALVPAAAASASVGGSTPPITTGPGGFPPISLPTSVGNQIFLTLDNDTDCDLVLMTNTVTGGYWLGSPPQVLRSGVKLTLRQLTATSDISETLDYGVVCDLHIGSPVVAQDTVELTFHMPNIGPPNYILKDLNGDFQVTAPYVSITSGLFDVQVDVG